MICSKNKGKRRSSRRINASRRHITVHDGLRPAARLPRASITQTPEWWSDAISASASGSGDWRRPLPASLLRVLPRSMREWVSHESIGDHSCRPVASETSERPPQSRFQTSPLPFRRPLLCPAASQRAHSSQTSKRSSILRVIFPYIHSIKHR